jgi:hypothetical protein
MRVRDEDVALDFGKIGESYSGVKELDRGPNDHFKVGVAQVSVKECFFVVATSVVPASKGIDKLARHEHRAEVLRSAICAQPLPLALRT